MHPQAIFVSKFYPVVSVRPPTVFAMNFGKTCVRLAFEKAQREQKFYQPSAPFRKVTTR